MVVKLPRVIILDSMGHDYGGGCVVRDGRSLVEYYNRVRTFNRFCIIVRPHDMQTMDLFFRSLEKIRNTWIVIDEVDRYCTPHQIRPGLEWLINCGRHFNLSILAASRRPHKVHRDLTAQADVIVVHQMHEARDLEYMSDFIPIDGIRHMPKLQWRAYGRSEFLPAP